MQSLLMWIHAARIIKLYNILLIISKVKLKQYNIYIFFPEDVISIMFHFKNYCGVFIDVTTFTFSFTTFMHLPFFLIQKLQKSMPPL